LPFIDLAKNVLEKGYDVRPCYFLSHHFKQTDTLIQFIMKVHAACHSHNGLLGIEYLDPSSCVNEVSRLISCSTCLTFLSFEETVSNPRLSIMSKWHLLSFSLLWSCVNALSWQEFGHWDQVERPIGTRRRIRDFNSGLINGAQKEKQTSNIERLLRE
jgi:hypothetical protein